MTIPTLETARLRLRSHDVADFAACVAMWSDPEITRYTIGQPSPPQRTWLRVLSYAGHWALLGFGYWALEEKATGRMIGELGFADFKRGLGPSTDGVPELGWALASHAHGKGYATEALTAAIAWADRNFEDKRTVCIIHPENAASIRVAGKTGYREFARNEKDGQPMLLFERLRAKTSDDAFLEDFEACRIPKSEWTHLAHVRMAWIYLRRHEFPAALERIRGGIQRYNKAVGGPANGYHETVTQAYARLVGHCLAQPESRSLGWKQFSESFAFLLDRKHPPVLKYYRGETISSDEARTRFVEPDLAPLP